MDLQTMKDSGITDSITSSWESVLVKHGALFSKLRSLQATLLRLSNPNNFDPTRAVPTDATFSPIQQLLEVLWKLIEMVAAPL